MNKKNTLVVLCMGLLFSCKKNDMPALVSPKPEVAILATNLNVCTADMHLLKKNGISTSAVGNTTSFWPNNPNGPTVIRVKFLAGGGGSPFVRNKIKTYAKIWENYANVRFDFVESNQYADVRITNRMGSGSWSYVGTQSLSIPYNQATMNYDSFSDATTNAEFYRVVVHEFGHALGLGDEKNHPLVSLQWNKPYIYDYYMMYGWTQAQIDQFFFSTFPITESSYSGYDPTSLMHFPIPAAFTLDGVSIWNTTLSTTDKYFIQKIYPFSTTTPSETELYTITGYTGYINATLTTNTLDIKKSVTGDIFLYASLPEYSLDVSKNDQYTIRDAFANQYNFTSYSSFNARTATGLKAPIKIFKNGVQIY